MQYYKLQNSEAPRLPPLQYTTPLQYSNPVQQQYVDHVPPQQFQNVAPQQFNLGQPHIVNVIQPQPTNIAQPQLLNLPRPQQTNVPQPQLNAPRQQKYTNTQRYLNQQLQYTTPVQPVIPQILQFPNQQFVPQPQVLNQQLLPTGQAYFVPQPEFDQNQFVEQQVVPQSNLNYYQPNVISTTPNYRIPDNTTLYGTDIENINKVLLESPNRKPKPSEEKPEDKQTVQLLYVPLERLTGKNNNQDSAEKETSKVNQYSSVPSSQQPILQYQYSDFTNNENKKTGQQLPQRIEKDFIEQALEAHRLQLQLKNEDSSKNIPVSSTIKPPRKAPPPTKKRKPHQPPLAVYMESEGEVKISDVLSVLKNAKSIDVRDSVGPDSPQVFVGPSNLDPPEGYAKFELPYLSNLDSNRVERKVEQYPFFVAPLSYKTPPGFAKIPLPSPHVGSVVVSQKNPLEENQTSKPTSARLNIPTDDVRPVNEPHNLRPTHPPASLFSTTSRTPHPTRANPFAQTINHYELQQINNQFIPQQQYQLQNQAQHPQFDTIPQTDLYSRVSSTTPVNVLRKNRPKIASSTPRPTQKYNEPSTHAPVNVNKYSLGQNELLNYQTVYANNPHVDKYGQSITLQPGETYQFVDIPQESYNQQLVNQQILREQEKLNQKKINQERIIQERLNQEKINQERLEKERLNQERLKQEQLNQEKINQERINQEKLNQERLNKERKSQERKNQERLNQHRIKQQERINQQEQLLSPQVVQLSTEDIQLALQEQQRYQDLLNRQVEQQHLGKVSSKYSNAELNSGNSAAHRQNQHNNRQQVIHQTPRTVKFRPTENYKLQEEITNPSSQKSVPIELSQYSQLQQEQLLQQQARQVPRGQQYLVESTPTSQYLINDKVQYEVTNKNVEHQQYLVESTPQVNKPKPLQEQVEYYYVDTKDQEQPLKNVRPQKVQVNDEITYAAVDNSSPKSVSQSTSLPTLITNLQDQSLRPLLVPASIAPSSDTSRKVTPQYEISTRYPSNSASTTPSPSSISHFPSPVTSTTSPSFSSSRIPVSSSTYATSSIRHTTAQPDTTTTKRTRGRQRGGSRYSSISSTTSIPRRSRTRKTTTPRTRYSTSNNYASNSEENYDNIDSKRTHVTPRQRFRTRGRPTKTEITERIAEVSTTEGTVHKHHPQLLGGFQASAELPQRHQIQYSTAKIAEYPVTASAVQENQNEQYLIDKYQQIYSLPHISSTEGNIYSEDTEKYTPNRYVQQQRVELQQQPVVQQQNLLRTKQFSTQEPSIISAPEGDVQYVRFLPNSEARQVPHQRLRLEPSTERPTPKIRVRTRTRPTTTTQRTTTTTENVNESAEGEFYGFFRQPDFNRPTDAGQAAVDANVYERAPLYSAAVTPSSQSVIREQYEPVRQGEIIHTLYLSLLLLSFILSYKI